eukprot:m.40327 g.40327  ORF g.40327 m.40327 type:complete len:388 (+) comp11874_c0_seq1:119-1282(+)
MGRVPIPFWEVQHDFAVDLRAGHGHFWISYREPGKATTHADVHVKGGALHCVGLEAEATCLDERTIKLNGAFGSVSFTSPLHEFTSVLPQPVHCLDVSPDGQLGLACSQDGLVNVFLTGDGTVQRRLEGHFGDVFTSRFFPSGEVVLTGGADLRVRIWSVADGSNPVSLTGHAGGILDTAIVDRGRNVLSASRDGTVRLWDCGTSQCLAVVADVSAAVNAIALAARPALCSQPGAPHEREVGTDGMVALLATEDGRIACADVRARSLCFSLAHDTKAAFNACCFLDDNHVLAGAQDGALFHVDLRNTSTPLNVYQRNESPIQSVRAGPSPDTFVASNGNGACFRFNMREMKCDYAVGPAAGSINSVVARSDGLFTGGKDRIVRFYRV